MLPRGHNIASLYAVAALQPATCGYRRRRWQFELEPKQHHAVWVVRESTRGAYEGGNSYRSLDRSLRGRKP